MTQEELDALMAGGLDDFDDTPEIINEPKEEMTQEIVTEPEKESKKEDIKMSMDPSDYRVSAESAWPPPPPTDDHKMVHQLDDVTRDSEKKATEILDKLDVINNFFMDAESVCNELKSGIDANIEIFTTLKDKFPHVGAFSEALNRNESLKNSVDDIVGNLQMGEDEIMATMDMMQYQDIHRQKIERVINVMRALSKYMNTLFEGKIDDEKRVSSAVHIAGDTTTENLVSNDDIEALIASLGNKK
ncbi:chemotaxis protein [Campylobacter sp. faydin G-140]|uniref:chemotaxis protein n=1 Tax=Campylobacter anatolicus TaxID=2829105 RepID=UPI001B9351C1|nr:chemotaxis protein [Campylobacter anatolicus]MBR8464832.1 chemotaxis protein [Campylobacter anatolicus]